jgi:hypothetical protein
MLIFRSEDHLAAWLASDHPSGERMSPQQQWDLSKAWFAGRNTRGWKKRTPEEAEEVFRNSGLTGGFWKLR